MIPQAYKHSVCGLLIALLMACSQAPQQKQTPIPTTAPPLPSHWTIKAKLGIRTEEESGSVSLIWQQRGDSYTIRVRAPLGSGSAVITGNREQITIERPGKPIVYSHNPQSLIEQTFGWSLPINVFKFWIWGTNAPEHIIEAVTYSPSGTISSLQQLEWQLSYSRHKIFNQWLLPSKIKAQHNNTQLILAIREWKQPQ